MPKLSSLILFIFTFSFSIKGYAEGKRAHEKAIDPSNLFCGIYRGTGRVRTFDSRLYLVVFEKSLSEIRLRIRGEMLANASGFNDEWVDFEGDIRSRVLNYRGFIYLKSIDVGMPNYIDANRSVILVNQKTCT
jgi:hypothetical protein